MKILIDIPTDQYNEIVYVNYERLKDIVRDGVVIEKCEDAISREAVIQIIENKLNPCTDMFKCLEMSEIKEDVEHLSPVQPQRMQGEWIEVFVETPNDPYRYGFKAHKCSKCEYRPFQISDYCPNCGAEMEVANEIIN